MPTPVIPNGYARATHVFSLSGDPEPITFHLDINVDNDFIPQLAEEVYNSWEEAWLTSLSNQFVFVRVDVDGVTDVGTPYQQSYAENQIGALAPAVLPQNCCALVRKVTGIPGRKNRGRVFMPGVLVENLVTAAGALDSTLVDDLQVAADAWKTNLDAVDSVVAPVILSSDPADFPTPIISFNVDNRITTQRRRLR